MSKNETAVSEVVGVLLIIAIAACAAALIVVFADSTIQSQTAEKTAPVTVMAPQFTMQVIDVSRPPAITGLNYSVNGTQQPREKPIIVGNNNTTGVMVLSSVYPDIESGPVAINSTVSVSGSVNNKTGDLADIHV